MLYPKLDAALVVVMLVGLVGYFWNRWTTKGGRSYQRGIGVRGIQFAGVCMLIPGVLILALECKLSECSTGTIIGAFAGYLFSGLSTFDSTEAGSEPEAVKPEHPTVI
jgi:hypothetical protein